MRPTATCLVLAALLTACGSKDDTADTGEPDVTGTGTGATGSGTGATGSGTGATGSGTGATGTGTGMTGTGTGTTGTGTGMTGTGTGATGTGTGMTGTGTGMTGTGTGSTTGPGFQTISSIQMGGVLEDTRVTTSGIVTAATWNGVYIQMPAGGQWSGIFVNLGALWEGPWGGIGRGHEVTVVGTYREAFGESQIDVQYDVQGSIRVNGVAVEPAPAKVTLADLQYLSAEPWEGVLVEVGPVTVDDPAADFNEWTVTDGTDSLPVDDHNYSWPERTYERLANGDPYDFLVGPVSYNFSEYKIEPRNARDIAPTRGGTATPPTHTISDIQNDLVALDTVVTVEGTVTGTGANGIFIQTPGGAARSGIFVFLGGVWAERYGGIAVGQHVVVSGNYTEFFDASQVDVDHATSPLVENWGNTDFIAPTPITAAQAGEDWEGVLIVVEDVEVVQPDIGFNEFTITDDGGTTELAVDDRLYRWPEEAEDRLSAGTPIPRVVGPLDYAFSAFKIVPRGPLDYDRAP